ncbi:Golgi autoantigen, golgin subfamily a, 2 [Elysia marginata]|uniref:Golgi autoantigen, golgin subfamily a, 2 n=1 Tax=Elysia marginata TaxID=1093978 RepID=A0AAV4G3S8_9GAST|nr:Golgi autoantigen, golgin subfamily a, 2 [Elysia marginata]
MLSVDQPALEPHCDSRYTREAKLCRRARTLRAKTFYYNAEEGDTALKQFQKSGRARSVSRTRDSAEREVQKENEPLEKIGRKNSPVEEKTSTPEIPLSQNSSEPVSEHEPQSNGNHETERTTASTESLHQLSRQINGLLLESGAILGSGDSTRNGVQELEERNRDLAALLEQHVQTNEQLNAQNQQLREHSKALQDQLEAERNLFHEKQKKDIGSLKEQLQVHIQTIGILVAEKTELQSQVGQSQRVSDQRLEEIEELNGRLKASRQRVSDLERSLSTSSQSSQNLQKSAAEHSKEIERLKLELYNSKKHKEELQQETLELREQVQLKTAENGTLSNSVSDLEKRLEMAELYAQQLSSENESSQGNIDVLNNLQKERDSLLDRLRQHEDLSQKLQLERDQVTEQYQQYTDQLRHQGQQLTQQITVLTEEREQLLNRQHDLEGSVLELQRKLEDIGNAPPVPTPQPQVPTVPPEVTQELESLRANMAQATETLESQVRDNMQLSRLLEEKEDRISLLERTVEEMGQREGDQAQLLESVQSDRTALSRALTQNKDLKAQLTELQAGFVKMRTGSATLVLAGPHLTRSTRGQVRLTGRAYCM